MHQKEGEEKRKCRVCGEEKPANTEHYYRHPQQKTGLDTQCKCCKDAYMKKRREGMQPKYKKKEKYHFRVNTFSKEKRWKRTPTLDISKVDYYINNDMDLKEIL